MEQFVFICAHSCSVADRKIDVTVLQQTERMCPHVGHILSLSVS